MSVPPTPVGVDGDLVRLAQALANLLRNASQYSPPDSPLSLSLEAADGLALIRVQDSGAGIDPRALPRLFEPFRQGGQWSTPTAGGLGLGLALVKGIAQLHGGGVEAHSPGPGRGSTFILHLPLSPAAATAPPPANPSDRARSRAAGCDEHLRKPLGEEARRDALSRCP